MRKKKCAKVRVTFYGIITSISIGKVRIFLLTVLHAYAQPYVEPVCLVYVFRHGAFLNTLCRRRFMRRSLSPFGPLFARVKLHDSCTARLSSSKKHVVQTRGRATPVQTRGNINKIYPWTTHVRLSYFKTRRIPQPRCSRVASNFQRCTCTSVCMRRL